jgi:hypothetical protein
MPGHPSNAPARGGRGGRGAKGGRGEAWQTAACVYRQTHRRAYSWAVERTEGAGARAREG